MRIVKAVVLMATLSISACSKVDDSVPMPPQNLAELRKSEAEIAQEKEQRKAEMIGIVTNQEASTKYRLDTAKTLISELQGSPEAESIKAMIPALESEHAKLMEEISYKWYYHASEDLMTSKKNLIARVQSSNSFEFDFPYQGRQKAHLTIRKHPQYGRDVIFYIEKGQIICSSYSCPIVVRFDDGRAINVKGSEPEDGSTEVVFLPLYDTMMRRLSSASTVRIQFQVFQQGSYVAEFDVRGFKPENMN